MDKYNHELLHSPFSAESINPRSKYIMKRLLSFSVVFLLVGTSWSARDDQHCPPSTEIPSCRCQYRNFYISPGTAILCSNINSPQELKDLVQNLRGYKIDLLQVGKSNISFLPTGLFSGTWVRNLRFTDSTIGNLSSLKESDPSPFDGLEDSLEELQVKRVSDPSKWHWPNLRNLKKLKTVEFTQSPLNFVSQVFAEIGDGSLQSLSIWFSEVYRIHPQAFVDLKDMTKLDLESNSVSSMARSMFPNPALKLTFISLRHNSLDVLPEDMFVNMPALDTLDLSGNKLRTFSEKMYSPLWNQLEFFNIDGNPLTCDCHLRWLRRKMDKKNYPFKFFIELSECSSPADVAGQKLSSLSVDQLIC